MKIRTRFAPTPSGYLHAGNAVNFVLTAQAVGGGEIHLRIDDSDTGRCRPEYVEDVFRSLEWLGLTYTHNYRQSERLESYRTFALALPETYACRCPRAAGPYPGTCRELNLPLEPGVTCLRKRIPSGVRLGWKNRVWNLAELMGDFVIWRKDDLPASLLTSIHDDLKEGVNLIVRGEDLLPVSLAQHFLAAEAGAGIRYLHHPLLTDERDGKLSKSRGSQALFHAYRAGESPRSIFDRAEELAAGLGKPAAIINVSA